MYRTILLPFCDDDMCDSAAEQACILAENRGGHIEGLFITRPPQVIEAEGIALAGAYVQEIKEEWGRREESARERFEGLMSSHGVPMRAIDAEGSGSSASWRAMQGQEGQVIGDYGRLFDLIVVSRVSKRALVDWEVMCEAAFFESGRPVWLASTETPATLAKTVAIHWNGSPEAARTIALAMPLIVGASKVHVIHIPLGGVPGPSGDDVARHLRRNGLNADCHTVDARDIGNGPALIEEVVATGADLLVKGAYTQGRLRQLVFGGATREVLARSPIPVIMAR